MNYREAVDYIFGHTNYEAVPRVPHEMGNYDLRRLYEALARVGDPHLQAKSVHIAGTNGKGSTSAMLASVLTASGFTTGLYTSPHLVTMRERIMVDGQMIGEGELADLMTRLKPDIEAVNAKATYGRLTVFEILTLLGFVYFAQKHCQFQVMEVGMGGRFDATNVVRPEVCLITSINYDHMEVLGDTLTKIAMEKCGIIKPGCVVVSHPQVPEAARVIERTCIEKRVPLIKVGHEVTRRPLGHSFDGQHLIVKGRLDSYRVSIPLLGNYQLDNAAAAIAALEALIERGERITKADILRGLGNVDFPGRMQILRRDPFVVVDGGHNPGAAHRLKEALKAYFKPSRTTLIVGISNDKDIAGIVKELAPVFQRVIVTRANNPRSTPPEALSTAFSRIGKQAEIARSVPEAIEEALRGASPQDLVCITGSLFVVGEAVAYFQGSGST